MVPLGVGYFWLAALCDDMELASEIKKILWNDIT